MWKTDGGAKQSTRRGGLSLTKDMQTEHELIRVDECQVTLWSTGSKSCMLSVCLLTLNAFSGATNQ